MLIYEFIVITFPYHWQVILNSTSDAELNKEQMVRKKVLSSVMSQNKQKRTEVEIVHEVCFVHYFLTNLVDRAFEVKWPIRNQDLNDFLNELFV